MEKKKKSSFDIILFADIVILSVFGLIMVFSASAPFAFKNNGSSFYFVKKQFIFLIVGFFALFFCASFDYKKYKKLMPYIYIANIIVLIIVLAIGTSNKGGKRWINLGFFTIQPSEFSKIIIVMSVAYYFSIMKNRKMTFKNVYLPLIIFAGIPCILILLEKHFSIIVIIALTVFGMMLIYGIELKFYVPVFLIGIPAAISLIMFSGYRSNRITAFLHPFEDVLGDSWQIVQSLYAIGSGGLFGLGLSRSRQKHLYMSEPQNDYIFSIICEELGIVGGIIVLILFGILMWRCIKIATECEDTFGTYLSYGLILLLIVQVILNIGVATNLLPPTGIPLPFFSAGGSLLIANMMSMGIVLNISRHRS